MGEVRQRKKNKGGGGSSARSDSPKRGTGTATGPKELDPQSLLRGIIFVAGLAVCVYVGQWFGSYMTTLHENHLWFSNIKEVEREISLRTECGLYYSYYKQLIKAPTLVKGIQDLLVDNSTEHGRTINILQRFNVYQELALAVIYRGLNLWNTLQPILFYVYSCFYLTGLGVSVLFLLTWYITGTWMGGLLAAVYFTVNLDDATRVFFTVNLREIFAFPFLWAQIFSVCVYLERRHPSKSGSASQTLAALGISIFGFLFAIMWQFNQFVFLIQAMAVYALGVLQLAPLSKLRNILLLQFLSLLGVCAMQFFQPMILGSLVVSFTPAALITLYACRGFRQSGGIVYCCFKVLIQCFLTLALLIAINIVLKKALQMEADEHIFKFLLGKFGLADPRDFESKVYLCHGAFVFLDNGFFWRTTESLLFPPYMVVFCGILFVIGRDLLLEWCDAAVPSKAKHKPLDPNDPSDKLFYFNQRPNLAYLAIQSCISGVIALMTLRMKYLWTPHLVILASVGFSDASVIDSGLELWRKGKTGLRNVIRFVVPAALCAFLIWQYHPTYQSQMADLKEFWDPDTVELMEWINNNTKPTDSFGGSMQLLAGVKCSTGRHLTNHPHFEDKWLRDRTKKIYQIYGRLPPREVYDLLKAEGTDYFILEDSICLAPSDGCRTPDLIDLENGHIPDNGKMFTGLVANDNPRFCNEIRHETTAYSRLFTLVMSNKTFRVYKLVDNPPTPKK